MPAPKATTKAKDERTVLRRDMWEFPMAGLR